MGSSILINAITKDSEMYEVVFYTPYDDLKITQEYLKQKIKNIDNVDLFEKSITWKEILRWNNEKSKNYI